MEENKEEEEEEEEIKVSGTTSDCKAWSASGGAVGHCV